MVTPTRIRLVGLGAGGHAKVVIEILRLDPRFEIVALLDCDPRTTHVLGIPVIGSDEKLPELVAQGVRDFFVGVGGGTDVSPRRRLYELAVAGGLQAASAIHSSAIISPSSTLGAGLTVMAGAIVNASAALGDNVILNSGAIIEHDCIIGAHAHIASGAVLSGGVRIGAMAFVGAGATIRQGVTIGGRAVIGAGAVVVEDIPAGMVAYGNPARVRTARETATSILSSKP